MTRTAVLPPVAAKVIRNGKVTFPPPDEEPEVKELPPPPNKAARRPSTK